MNNDGFPDLFVSGIGRSQLFRNNGDGTFQDVSQSAGVSAPTIGSSSLWCDFDNDGWLDIVQSTYSRVEDAIFSLQNGNGPSDGFPMKLFRNNRDGTFTDVGKQKGVNGCWGTMSLCCGDFDNDGRLDFFTGNGDPKMDRNEPAVLLKQDESGNFRDVTLATGLPVTGKGHGTVMADLNGDGRLHLIVANGGLYPGDLLATSVFQPEALPGSYISIELVGRESNRSAIGARIQLRSNGKSQFRLVSGGSNFGCAPFRQHFGLGDGDHVDSVEIIWPNGKQQELKALSINQLHTITEFEDGDR